jgi:hypothetical protein
MCLLDKTIRKIRRIYGQHQMYYFVFPNGKSSSTTVKGYIDDGDDLALWMLKNEPIHYRTDGCINYRYVYV